MFQGSCYHTTGALNWTVNSTGARGPNATQAALIVNSNGSADIYDVNAAYGHFENMTLLRSVLPTGTANGMLMNGAFAVIVKQIYSFDSINPFHFENGSGSGGSGVFENNVAGWCALVSCGSYTTQTVSGFFNDSTGGNGNFSLRLRHNFVLMTSLPNTVTSMGYRTDGNEINDYMSYGNETAGGSYPEYVNYTGGGGGDSAADQHHFGDILDGCVVTCIYVRGIPSSGVAESYLEFSGGHALSQNANTGPTVDIGSSYGVSVSSMDIGNGPGSSQPVVSVTGGSSQITIAKNQFMNNTSGGTPEIYNNGTTFSSFTDNRIPVTGATTVIDFVGSSNNTEGFNTVSGTGTLGLLFDATSNNNSSIGDTFATGITTPTSNLGTGNVICNVSLGCSNSGALVPPYTYLELDTLPQL